MSKNVAVFVDVANIFYAAKAAGVDIDYVTLLKSATAGRDFVRAYAYTGLDPENENQRQFHNFLARSGYKVISKDIRKYGDGRVKANLDIELVVDMMKTARNLDIAVVVSGDGDFAPAIRAVQEMGVRVEVISFRGNTSSDLIDVADLFTDIAQVARVEKGSARSGRRVAAEGDLSMTEVPEKETEGAPRRRRASSRSQREERVAAEVDAGTGNLIVLPGERLSRAPEGEEGELEELAEADVAEGSANGAEADDGRRRRRRRGGRGRGRGRRPEDEAVGTADPAAFAADEEEDFEEIPVAQPAHHSFGSVWDSQLGVSSAGVPPTVDLGGGESIEDEDYDEPEVPEYLLAERRQRGQRGQGSRGRQGGGRGRGGAYQAALDRERYGRSTTQPSYGGGTSSGSRSDRGRDRNRQGRSAQSGRPSDRTSRASDRVPMEPRPASSEPWSEVPPELEQMLRAELERKQPAAELTPVEPVATPAAEAPAAEAKPKRTTRARTTTSRAKATSADAQADAEAAPDTAAEAPAAEAKPKRTTRARTTTSRAKATSADAQADAEAAPDTAAEAPAADAKPKRTTRARTTKAKAEAEEA